MFGQLILISNSLAVSGDPTSPRHPSAGASAVQQLLVEPYIGETRGFGYTLLQVPLERGGSETKLFDREQLLLITNATPGALLRRPSASFSGHSKGMRSPASLQATHADSGGVPVMINLRTAFWRR
ncbi:hypothetical protein N7488_010421 [Penicillium malachiteum]|nr:hypothetical protein N7488_010421 [Penicillium malachiteum]